MRSKITFGLLAGILGIVLMFYGFHFTGNIILDHRFLPIILAALIAGMTGSLISSFIIVIGRLLFWDTDLNILFHIIPGLFFMGLGSGLISKLSMGQKRKWMYLLLFCLLNATFTVSPILDSVKMVLQYNATLLIGGYIMYLSCHYVSENNQLYRTLKDLSMKDHLTGLLNGREFDRKLKSYLNDDRMDAIALILIDIDFFKKINDTYGHMAGDAVLKEFAQFFHESGEKNVEIFRKGGEEFALLLPNKEVTDAASLAEKIRVQIKNHLFSAGEFSISFTVSAGVSQFPALSSTKEELFTHADECLYVAKNSGRNAVKVYSR
jgi:diguanylate cyclase